mgnify:CR=1 FL=1
MGALEGVKVVDLSRLLPGPYCSMVLADHGADVIAVEDRRFIADDLYFADVYRNKRHMTLNLKSQEGREIFCLLATEADVIIEGFRPGVVDRLGVGYEDIRQMNPAIIYCSISGYGQTGPAAHEAGHDVNYLSRAGVLDCIGPSHGPPVIPAVQAADIAGGGMNGVIGILLALYERNRSGRGQHIDISMTDGILNFLTLPHILSKKTGKKQRRSQSMLSHRFACYNTYETADGRYLALGAVENRFWRTLCSILEVEEYVELQYDEGRRREIVDRLRAIFASRPLSHWHALLDGADVCYSPIQDIDEVLGDELFVEREMIVDIEGEKGSEKTFGIAVKLDRTPGAVRSSPPAFGRDTGAILTELGYDEDAVDRLQRQGVV